VLHHLADRLKRRGLVVLISDLLDDPTRILHGLAHLRHNEHEVIVLQVLDPAERTFPFERITRFEGLEGGGRITADPRSLRAYVHRLLAAHRGRRACVLLVVDQRMDMFFGTRKYMKSVTAAEAAALAAWRVLNVGDRVGALVFNDDRIEEIRPHRSRQRVMQILETVVRMNHALRVDAEVEPRPVMLNQALESASRIAGHDYLVTVISDFDGTDGDTERMLQLLAAHNDVLAVLVHDPSATHLPRGGDLVATDGRLQFELPLGKEATRRDLLEFARGRIARVLGWQQGYGIPVLPLETAEEVAPQVRRLLGELRRQGR
jgi:uncharacterized protein (DUF58 family)